MKISSLLRCRGAAGRACRILADADRMKAGTQRIVEQQGAVEAVAEPQELLQYLDRLQGAEDAGDGAEDARMHIGEPNEAPAGSAEVAY